MIISISAIMPEPLMATALLKQFIIIPGNVFNGSSNKIARWLYWPVTQPLQKHYALFSKTIS